MSYALHYSSYFSLIVCSFVNFHSLVSLYVDHAAHVNLIINENDDDDELTHPGGLWQRNAGYVSQTGSGHVTVLNHTRLCADYTLLCGPECTTPHRHAKAIHKTHTEFL